MSFAEKQRSIKGSVGERQNQRAVNAPPAGYRRFKSFRFHVRVSLTTQELIVSPAPPRPAIWAHSSVAEQRFLKPLADGFESLCAHLPTSMSLDDGPAF